MRSSFRGFALALAATAAGAGSVRAAVFASAVISSDQGAAARADGFLSTYSNADAVLHAPDPITGENENGFPNVLNPFSPAYETDEIYVVGQGGHITVRLPNYAQIGTGLELGVISNAGLQDKSFSSSSPPGTNFNPARSFSGGVADVQVSENGVSWVSLGRVTFNVPTNYYTNVTSPYQDTAPPSPALADYGLPFTGSLSSFDGKSFSQTIAALGGSGGGTWLDLSGTGLTRVGYIEFSVGDYTPGVIDRLGIDAIVIANDKVGAAVPVPEPAGIALLAIAGTLALRRRRLTLRCD